MAVKIIIFALKLFMKKTALILMLFVFFSSCKKNETAPIKKIRERKEPKNITYTLKNAKEWLKNNSDTAQLNIVMGVNRTDKKNLAKMDSILIPSDLKGDIEFYLNFPVEVPYLDSIKKIIYFSYATQTFAAYENGSLIYSGPTNMGRKKDPTPAGLFFTNWKAEQTTSTFNDEWDLKWNFNIANKLGVGFHEYELPGYPASHSCLRLQEKDAKYLYNWADQWILKDEHTVLEKGTPVVVFGSYDFDGAKPWLQLVKNPTALDISASDLENVTKPYLKSILAEQEKRSKTPAVQ